MVLIAVLAGDGIGPEIMIEGVRALSATAKLFGIELALEEALVGGAAYDAGGHPLPDETLALCKRADAIYLGAVGGPKYDAIPDPNLRPERGALLPLRKHLGLFANLRPARLYASLSDACPLRPDKVEGGFDILVVRELTGGLYFGQPKSYADHEAIDTCRYTRAEIERIAHVGFQAARKRPRKVVTSVDKANVMETSRLWRTVVTEIGKQYTDIALNHMLVDSAAMALVKSPKSFDVILTENLFGDILSDEAAELTGSLGMLPSASLGQGGAGLYEPSHGSAPDIAGTGKANPLATILSGAMLLRHSLNRNDAATALEAAVERVIELGYRTPDIARPTDAKLVSCGEMGELVVKYLEQ
jgi:3-isopropylmalate dehydrogenase